MNKAQELALFMLQCDHHWHRAHVSDWGVVITLPYCNRCGSVVYAAGPAWRGP